MRSQRVELLAPAANLAVGIAAIDAGADAVYIGGAAFGARAAAGNSMEDIECLCNYAHQFGARVFLALNTLIAPDEVDQAVALAWSAYNAGVDAIILQDFSLLDAALPPMEMHASTQCFNFDIEKVAALVSAGFKRVVLERALSAAEIRAICAASAAEIEVFVHGAICVGYSGRCNFSQHLTGRSGNRGQCAQPCRSVYDLVDANGRVLFKNEAMLSPRDLNLSAKIGELVAAGVCSLKIEGRLKDISYVSNVTAHYNKILNDLGVERTSVGRSAPNFTPNVALSFNRGFTQWFYDGAAAGVGAAGVVGGQFIGGVASLGDRFFTVGGGVELSNGDGIAFIGDDGCTTGVRVNRVDGERVFPLNIAGIKVGTKIFRTLAAKFNPTSSRTIDVDIEFSDKQISVTDGHGASASVALPTDLEKANNSQSARENIKKSLSKSGDTIFSVRTVEFTCHTVPFIPTSQLNSLRRQLLTELAAKRLQILPATTAKPCTKPILPPEDTAYLMRSRYCILREKGLCLKHNTGLALPLDLVNNGRKVRLKFDCAACEMYILGH